MFGEERDNIQIRCLMPDLLDRFLFALVSILLWQANLRSNTSRSLVRLLLTKARFV